MLITSSIPRAADVYFRLKRRTAHPKNWLFPPCACALSRFVLSRCREGGHPRSTHRHGRRGRHGGDRARDRDQRSEVARRSLDVWRFQGTIWPPRSNTCFPWAITQHPYPAGFGRSPFLRVSASPAMKIKMVSEGRSRAFGGRTADGGRCAHRVGPHRVGPAASAGASLRAAWRGLLRNRGANAFWENFNRRTPRKIETKRS